MREQLENQQRLIIKHFASIAKLLHHHTEKGVSITWMDACGMVFIQFCEALAETPMPVYPKPCLPLNLDMDTSSEGLGAMLSQAGPGGERVVTYFRRIEVCRSACYCVT